MKFECCGNDLECFIDGKVAVMKIHGAGFESISDLHRADVITGKFEAIDKDPNVSVLLILGDAGVYDEESYKNFVSNILGIDYKGKKKTLDYEKRVVRAREIKTLDRLLIKLLSMKKILISGVQGEIVTPFFGISLSLDFRFARKNAYFNPAHINMGLHPSGGLAFLLQRYVGQQKAVEILFSDKKICAKEALELGLVNEILDDDNFEEKILQKAHELAKIDPKVIESTKLLTYYYRDELRKYFEFEAKFIEM